MGQRCCRVGHFALSDSGVTTPYQLMVLGGAEVEFRLHDSSEKVQGTRRRWSFDLQLLSGRAFDDVDDFGAELNKLATWSRITLFEERTRIEVDPQDVGEGISQILPVIVALAAPGPSLVAIEQPELHVHPRMQVALGDLLIEKALDDRRMRKHRSRLVAAWTVVETHSEHSAPACSGGFEKQRRIHPRRTRSASRRRILPFSTFKPEGRVSVSRSFAWTTRANLSMCGRRASLTSEPRSFSDDQRIRPQP